MNFAKILKKHNLFCKESYLSDQIKIIGFNALIIEDTQSQILRNVHLLIFIVQCLIKNQIYNLLMQKDKERSKEYEYLKRELHSLLKDFQKNRQWADFSNWLHRLYEELSKKKFQDLPNQITLCKRLAQCLNPALPAGVHTTVLKVYEVILKNYENKTQLLPLIALGLFPFFQHSNYANKIALIKLFDEHFVNQAESVQMIVGLTNALLTGLNQNSEEFTRKIYSFFDKFSKNYGKIWVDGAVWINILKSPKVRLAGFKYFMKVFKDRDRVIQNSNEQGKVEEEQIIEVLQSKIQKSQLQQEQKVLLASLHGYRSRPDENFTRFPNFSTLIVNTLCICLEMDTDQMIKRSTLDLLINYLKLSTRIFEKEEGVLILEKMLQLLQSKQYNLTNRVYKYLFDQPNTEGQFHIDFEKKALELQILQEALSRLLQIKSHSKGESILTILEIILTDHPILTDFLLTRLSFRILLFIRDYYQLHSRRQSGLTKGIQDFYLGVVVKNKKLFLRSIIRLISNIPASKIAMEEQFEKIDKNQANSIELVLEVLQFYFSRLERIGNIGGSRVKNKGSPSSEQELQNEELDEYRFVRTIVIKQLITYIYYHPESSEKLVSNILDLSNQLLLQFLANIPEGQAFTSTQIQYLEELLKNQAKLSRKVLYAKLITLIPHPRKQQLLPYIQDSSLSIVCINILLGGDKIAVETLKLTSKDSVKSGSQKLSIALPDPIPLTKQEQKDLFTAIFKLLNCHLFQSRALDFIERFRHHYTETFNSLINVVEPSQWLIYWKKVEGDVSGGILRMIENLDCQNSYHKHLSRKWIVQSESIISKVIDPLYALMNRRQRKFSAEEERLGGSKTWNIEEYDKIYALMKLVFRSTSSNFSKYFFLQRDKYLNSFVIFVFKCIETDNFEIKSKSLQMLTFLLEQTRESQEKFDMVNLTLPNILSILDKIIDAKCILEENREKDPNQIVLLSNIQIELIEYISRIITNINQILKIDSTKVEQLIKILRSSNIYDITLKGMEHTQTSYIKTLYMDSGRQIAQMIAQLDKSKTEITTFMTKILESLFIMLKNTDMNTIQEIIKGRNGNNSLKQSVVRRKRSYTETEEQQINMSFYKESVKEQEIKHNLNLQQKYGEIIELWNAVKFYIQFAIKIQLKQMPVINLISLILQSFPFSYLKYTCAGGPIHQTNLETLQQEINNVTGLKKEVLEIFEILWNKENRQILDFLVEKGDPRILVHSSLDPTKVLETFNKNSKIKEVIRYYKNGKFNLPRNQLHYNLQTLLKENQLLYFIYVYFLYFNMKSFKNRRVSNFFDQLIQFLKIMKYSSHIQSKLWLLQILQLISQRMMVSKDITIDNWAKIKQEIQDITKQLVDEIVTIINKSKLFTHRSEVKTGIFNLFNKQEKQTSLYDFVKIFPPTIFESYEKYCENVKRISKNKEKARKTEKNFTKVNMELPRQRLYTFLMEEDKIILEKESKIDEYLFLHFLNRSDEEYINYLSLCSLKTLIRIGNSLLINVYEKQLTKINTIIKEILINILPICENREPSNQYFNQLIAQYLHTVLNHEQLRAEIIKMVRKNITDLFMGNDFFKCTQKTLFYWKVVIDYCTQNYDLLNELLTSEGLLEGLFTKKAQSTRQKIKSFERVCFVIYSGKIDKYENKLRTVLQSLNDVMKQDNPSPALLILILFCIRILLMRLSTISLNKLFRSVWPSLITVLIQIFKKDKGPKNINLQLAALKVIELIHALQLEEFMLHKWMFIFDYFGLKIEPMGDIEDNMKTCEVLSPFFFKPYLTNALPITRLRCKFMPDRSDTTHEKFMVKRRLIVKKTNMENEDELKQYCVLLMQYMMDLNEFRSQISKDDIENLIQDDFISLDNYIFLMK